MNQSFKRADGFSLIELLMAALIFTVVAGGIFSVLLSSQMRYQSDSGLTSLFQQANLVMDQITRDIHSAGYPPSSSFNLTVTQNASNWNVFAVAFPWSPNYPFGTCTLGAMCTSPADNDLLLEVYTDNQVQWVRYTLDGTTLKRGMTPKAANTDPLSVSALAPSNMLPYLENVVNQTQSTPRSVFTYFDNNGVGPSSPSNIFEVNICLIVQSPKPDPQTGQPRAITVTGQAMRFNPNQ
jgi:type II secretory pathway component PulJ